MLPNRNMCRQRLGKFSPVEDLVAPPLITRSSTASAELDATGSGIRRAVRSSACHSLKGCSCRTRRRRLSKRSGRYRTCLCFRCEICLCSRTLHDWVSCAFCQANSLPHVPQVRQPRGRPQLDGRALLTSVFFNFPPTRFRHSSVSLVHGHD